MPIDHRADGSIVVSPSRFYFVLAGLGSIVLGTALGYGIHAFTGWRLLPFSLTAIVLFSAGRRLFQGLVFTGKLYVEFDGEQISGPKFAWLDRGSIRASDVAWGESLISRRAVVLFGPHGREIAIRLAWFSPSDRQFVCQQIERLRNEALSRA